MNKSFLFSDELYQYVNGTFGWEHAVAKKLRQETERMPEAGMQIGPDQGQFLSSMLHLIGAKQTLEIGVFTGYSSLITALALPAGGKHVACDISEEYTNVAKRYWAEAGVSDKIELHVGPALESMDRLLEQKKVFDFCFIDADKPNYCGYYERAVQLIRTNGLILLDNMLWHGKIADFSDTSESVVALRQANEMVAKDPRVEACLVPIGDGMTMARKR